MNAHNEAERSLITVGRSDPLPPVCIECGDNTTRRVRVRAEPAEMPEDERAQPQTPFLPFTPHGLVLGLLKRLARRAKYALGQGRWQVSLRVPQCQACARHGRPEFVDVDYFKRTLILLVHPRFRRQLDSSFGPGLRGTRLGETLRVLRPNPHMASYLGFQSLSDTSASLLIVRSFKPTNAAC